MKLYEISDTFMTLFNSLESMTDDEELTPEEKEDRETAWFDTLEMLEEEFTDKAENVAAYIKMLKGEAEVLKAEEQELSRRRKAKERRAESLKAYLLSSMQAVSLSKIDRPMAQISIRNNAETAVFSDESGFIRWAEEDHDDLLRYKAPEIDKTAVKKYLQAGGEIPGVKLARSQSLMIK